MKVYSVRDLASEQGISEGDVRSILRSGAVTAKKLGTNWVVDEDGREELEDLLETEAEAEDTEAEDDDDECDGDDDDDDDDEDDDDDVEDE